MEVVETSFDHTGAARARARCQCASWRAQQNWCATAFAHRTSRILVNIAAFYGGPDDKPRRERWVGDVADALDQGDTGAYVGFLGDEGEARVRAAYPGATGARLRAIKRRYDPDNLFRRNQNIVPDSSPTQ